MRMRRTYPKAVKVNHAQSDKEWRVNLYRANKKCLRATLIGAIITLRAIFCDLSCQNLILKQNSTPSPKPLARIRAASVSTRCSQHLVATSRVARYSGDCRNSLTRKLFAPLATGAQLANNERCRSPPQTSSPSPSVSIRPLRPTFRCRPKAQKSAPTSVFRASSAAPLATRLNF